MAANKHVIGNTVTIAMTFKKLTNAFTTPPTYTAYDPATAQLITVDPNGAKVTYTAGVDSNFNHSGAANSGQYLITLDPTVPNTWTYQCHDPANPKGLQEGTFNMVAPKIT